MAYGDTVQWSALEGTHNVAEVSAPALFQSGFPAPAPWVYSFEFRLPLGTYTYACTAHMPWTMGQVTVIPYGSPPNIEFVEPSVAQLAVTGLSFRFRVAPTDEDQDLVSYAVSVDDTTHFTPWSPYAEFLIADLSLGLMPEQTTLVSNGGYQPGLATFYFRAMDSRGAVSPIIFRTVNMEAGHRPQMNAGISGSYGGADLYRDGSAYYAAGADVALAFGATASGYSGLINGYHYREGGGEWSEWSATPELTLAAAGLGEHALEIQARDMAGELSDPLAYTVRLVPFVLTDSIVVVDETRNGSGAQGLPNDAQVDDFYSQLLGAYAVRSVDYDSSSIGGLACISPYSLGQAGLVVWHSDDRTAVLWNEQARILGEYLDRGGRMLLSGWDLMKPYLPAGDSIVFNASAFPRMEMGLEAAIRNAPRSVTGMEGQNGFPTLTLDSTKILPAWHGVLDQGWVFRPQAGAVALGGLMVNDPLTNPRAHRPAAYFYEAGYRLAVFGVPLYFCRTEDVQAMMDTLLPMMFAPSAAPPVRVPEVADFTLEQNYPNPFNAQTEIRFTLPAAGPASLRVYDILGRQVATLVDGPLTAGMQRMRFDGAALASGVYFVELRQGPQTRSRKLLLLK